MRKITKEAVKAFISNENFKGSNTKVSRFADNISMFLHDNRIAKLSNGS